ncbi:1,2-phenylacetyl-CoA epoxidase subunit PaaE [Inquilinus limosus]|uniref:Phenylacetic acid degradation protein n=1 Tax=Inquilinus limosus MP06 TaxID=1398085 RepID=A0A0A0D489_9PROT|nr:1,2-phenylacetyl-CoA epoxidase subunit PaaE [Inquilinus limosus]KGM32919.1 phenylacetic acid degradation protein [Inquilinus limosus MP06]
MSAAPPRFHCLTIRNIRRETTDAVSIAFDVPGELDADYRFTPGQYLTLRASIDGEDLRRSYSICSGPDDGELRIAVKRVEGGVFSDWVNRTLQAGDAIEVMTPTGRFGMQQAPVQSRARTHVAFAAGSGITPVLSLLRGVLAREPESRFFLFYGNRSTSEILFREALEELKDCFLGRLSVFHVLSQEEQDLPILTGRLDGDKVRRLLRLVVPAEMIDEVYLCGPEGMSREIQTVLTELGVAPEKVHVELFVSALGGRPRPKPVAPAPDAPSRTAVLTVDGKRREVPVAEDESILDAALRAGVDLPYACKGGMCSTCRARLVEGEAAMDLNYSLEPWELEAGFILTCQSHPKTDRVVVDYDEM